LASKLNWSYVAAVQQTRGWTDWVSLLSLLQANRALMFHKRYMHYFTHFKNHQDSHKKEQAEK
jgi:hypothetical protein